MAYSLYTENREEKDSGSGKTCYIEAEKGATDLAKICRRKE